MVFELFNRTLLHWLSWRRTIYRCTWYTQVEASKEESEIRSNSKKSLAEIIFLSTVKTRRTAKVWFLKSVVQHWKWRLCLLFFVFFCFVFCFHFYNGLFTCLRWPDGPSHNKIWVASTKRKLLLFFINTGKFII